MPGSPMPRARAGHLRGRDQPSWRSGGCGTGHRRGSRGGMRMSPKAESGSDPSNVRLKKLGGEHWTLGARPVKRRGNGPKARWESGMKSRLDLPSVSLMLPRAAAAAAAPAGWRNRATSRQPPPRPSTPGAAARPAHRPPRPPGGTPTSRPAPPGRSLPGSGSLVGGLHPDTEPSMGLCPAWMGRAEGTGGLATLSCLFLTLGFRLLQPCKNVHMHTHSYTQNTNILMFSHTQMHTLI